MLQIETNQKLANSFAELKTALTATTNKLDPKQNDLKIYLFLIHRSLMNNLVNITV